MKDSVRKFTKVGDFVLDICAGTYPTAKAFRLLAPLKKFAGWDLDSDFLSSAQSELYSTLALHLLSLNSATSGEEEAIEAAHKFCEKVAVVLTYRRATALEVPRRLDATQVTPGHNFRFLSTIYEDYGL